MNPFSCCFGEENTITYIPVKKLEHFEQKKEYAVFCPEGQDSFAEGVDLISRAVLRCRRQKIERMLFDSTGLPRFCPPGMSEQYNLAERIASDAESLVKIAHVASPAWIRSGKFVLTVAKNRGLDVKNFRSEPEALKWLLTTAENRAGCQEKLPCSVGTGTVAPKTASHWVIASAVRRFNRTPRRG